MVRESRRRADGPWLTALLHASSQGVFFRNCTAHPGGVVNLFNLESCTEQCPGCFGAAARGGSAAPVESLLQIRRSSYHDVLRVADVTRLLDLSGVQTYLINQARVIFLNQRPQPRPPKGKAAPSTAGSRHTSAACENCHRNLQSEVAAYCSISCKVAKLGLPACCYSGPASPAVEDAAREPASEIKPPLRVLGKRSRSAAAAPSPTPTTPSRPLSRRKGNPRRSPDF